MTGKTITSLEWWNDSKYKMTIPLSISIIQDEYGFTASFNSETKLYLGYHLDFCSFAETENEAIYQLFEQFRFHVHYLTNCELKYQRNTLFIKGDWSKVGGSWFTIFGIGLYFRYGKGMKGGVYIPLTKMNVSLINKWRNIIC